MDPSTGHNQEMPNSSLENMLGCSSKGQQERKPRPQPEQALKCPRCDSTNTKFCYYNNYSLSQPRYFCKSCRRYWTKGGTLRNVPVGGGCRKNKRSSSSSKIRTQDQPNSNPLITTLPPLTYDTNDLSLAFARLQKQSSGQLGFDDHELSILGNPTTTHSHCDILGNPSLNSAAANSPAFLDALRNGFLGTTTHNNNFQNFYYGFGNHDNNNMGEVVDNNGEMMLPNYSEEMSSGSSNATTTAVTVTTMKQEFCNGRDHQSENRILWGLPWQLNGDHHHNHIGNNNLGELDSGRESWNGLNSSNWHGLLNSPLM